MKKQSKGGTADFRDELISDMTADVARLCAEKGYNPDKAVVISYVQSAIDNYVNDWYEVSLEAMDMMDGGADFTTDEEIEDPDVIQEAKRRVIKAMYEERPPGLHGTVAASIIHAINSNPKESDISF
ncbi:MAG TPA: hypothetical protein VHO84_06220 [Syntrophorhabdaceae bacterium]|nr:hypothetical protein [Syntrophorhabdaceae bacterium]